MDESVLCLGHVVVRKSDGRKVFSETLSLKKKIILCVLVVSQTCLGKLLWGKTSVLYCVELLELDRGNRVAEGRWKRMGRMGGGRRRKRSRKAEDYKRKHKHMHVCFCLHISCHQFTSQMCLSFTGKSTHFTMLLLKCFM